MEWGNENGDKGSKNLVKRGKPHSDLKSNKKQKGRRGNADDVLAAFPNFLALTEEERVAFFEALTVARKNVEKSGVSTPGRFGTVHDEYLKYFVEGENNDDDGKEPESESEDGDIGEEDAQNSKDSTQAPESLKEDGNVSWGLTSPGSALSLHHVTVSLSSTEVLPREPKDVGVSQETNILISEESSSFKKKSFLSLEPWGESFLQRNKDRIVDMYLNKKKRKSGVKQLLKVLEEDEGHSTGKKAECEMIMRTPKWRNKENIQPEKEKKEPKKMNHGFPFSKDVPRFNALSLEERKIFFSILKEAHDNILEKNPEKRNEIFPLEYILKGYLWQPKVASVYKASMESGISPKVVKSRIPTVKRKFSSEESMESAELRLDIEKPSKSKTDQPNTSKLDDSKSKLEDDPKSVKSRPEIRKAREEEGEKPPSKGKKKNVRIKLTFTSKDNERLDQKMLQLGDENDKDSIVTLERVRQMILDPNAFVYEEPKEEEKSEEEDEEDEEEEELEEKEDAFAKESIKSDSFEFNWEDNKSSLEEKSITSEQLIETSEKKEEVSKLRGIRKEISEDLLQEKNQEDLIRVESANEVQDLLSVKEKVGQRDTLQDTGSKTELITESAKKKKVEVKENKEEETGRADTGDVRSKDDKSLPNEEDLFWGDAKCKNWKNKRDNSRVSDQDPLSEGRKSQDKTESQMKVLVLLEGGPKRVDRMEEVMWLSGQRKEIEEASVEEVQLEEISIHVSSDKGLNLKDKEWASEEKKKRVQKIVSFGMKQKLRRVESAASDIEPESFTTEAGEPEETSSVETIPNSADGEGTGEGLERDDTARYVASSTTTIKSPITFVEDRPPVVEPWNLPEYRTPGKVVLVEDGVIEKIRNLINDLEKKAKGENRTLENEYFQLLFGYIDYLSKVLESLIAEKEEVKGPVTAVGVTLKFEEKQEQEGTSTSPDNTPGTSKGNKKGKKPEEYKSSLLSISDSDSLSGENLNLAKYGNPIATKKKTLPNTKIRLLQDLLKERVEFRDGSINDFKIYRLPEEEYVPMERTKVIVHLTDERQETTNRTNKFLLTLMRLCRCGKKDEPEEDEILENLKGEAVAIDVSEKQTKTATSATLNEATLEVLKAAERKKVIQKHWKST